MLGTKCEFVAVGLQDLEHPDLHRADPPTETKWSEFCTQLHKQFPHNHARQGTDWNKVEMNVPTRRQLKEQFLRISAFQELQYLLHGYEAVFNSRMCGL